MRHIPGHIQGKGVPGTQQSRQVKVSMTCGPPPPGQRKGRRSCPRLGLLGEGRSGKKAGFGEEGGQAGRQAEEVGPWAEGGGCGQGEAEAPREGRAVRATTGASSPGGTEHLRRSFIHSC